MFLPKNWSCRLSCPALGAGNTPATTQIASSFTAGFRKASALTIWQLLAGLIGDRSRDCVLRIVTCTWGRIRIGTCAHVGPGWMKYQIRTDIETIVIPNEGSLSIRCPSVCHETRVIGVR